MRGDGQPAYSPGSSVNAERRVERDGMSERERMGGRRGVRAVLCVLGGCGCSAASLDRCNLSPRLPQELLHECTLQE